MPRPHSRAHVDTDNGNGASVKFNLQEVLTQMEDRLGKRIDDVKTFCPNDKRIAKTESLVKWWGSAIVAALAAVVGVVAEHLLTGVR
jgi:hypothetical protein